MTVFGGFLATEGKVGDSMAGQLSGLGMQTCMALRERSGIYVVVLTLSMSWYKANCGAFPILRTLSVSVILGQVNVSFVFILIPSYLYSKSDLQTECESVGSIF
jgi:hypothetical protein